MTALPPIRPMDDQMRLFQLHAAFIVQRDRVARATRALGTAPPGSPASRRLFSKMNRSRAQLYRARDDLLRFADDMARRLGHDPARIRGARPCA